MLRRKLWKAVLLLAGAPLIVNQAAATCSGGGVQTCVLSDASHCTIPPIVVGSPSGLVRPYTIVLRNSSGQTISSPGAWLAPDWGDCAGGTLFYSTSPPGDDGPLHCHHEEWPSCFVSWEYLEAGVSLGQATFYPQFGGHGVIMVQHELACNMKYYDVTCVEARSTDLDSDGDTDQREKITLGQALASHTTDLNYDFDLDATVTVADYRILCEEMQRRPNGPLYVCPSGSLPDSFVADTNAPDTTTLALVSCTGGTVTLRWTSSGNDVVNGQRLGAAQTFDLRYSSSTITSGNFASASTITGEPTPDLPGAVHTMTINAAALGARYFAIKSIDYAGNVSPISNVLAVDIDAPGTVSDLSASCVGPSFFIMSWTAPGDDGSSGTATAFDIRYSQSEITTANFASATQLSNPPTPLAGGAEQGKSVSGLTQCRNYYFALKTRDEACNWSAMSNVLLVDLNCSGSFPCDEAARVKLEPIRTELSPPKPSPARSGVTIEYSIATVDAGAKLRVDVFDLQGRKIQTLGHGPARAGRFSMGWDLKSAGAGRVRPGLYFVMLGVGDSQWRRTLLVAE